MEQFQAPTPSKNNNFAFEIFCESKDFDGVTETMYGLKIYHNGKECMLYSALTDDYALLKALGKSFLDYDIDISHVHYIVEDFVSWLGMP